MSETTVIRYDTKCFMIFIVFYFITSAVQAKHDYIVILIERVVPGDVNYLAQKYNPAGVALPDLGTKFWAPLLQYRRKWNMYPRVEIGPGAFKSEILSYPPDKLANHLKQLLAIKAKKEEKHVDLNKGKEFFHKK